MGMGFIFKKTGSVSSDLSAVIASSSPPSDISKIWLDISSGKPVFKVYNSIDNLWVIAEGDINDDITADNQTWSSQQIVEMNGHTYIQSTPSDMWIINHSLNRMPAVHTIDNTGDEIIGEVSYESESRIVIIFSESVSGKAFLS